MTKTWMLMLVVAVGCAGAQASKPENRVKRGEYLVTTMGCNDCHTPFKFDPGLGGPVPDFSRRLSGHPVGGPEPSGTVGEHDLGLIGPTFTAFKMPFGTVYTRNLTPDPDTGLGRWTEAQFIQAMRTGRSMGVGRPLLPPMPWMNLAQATDEDLKAIFAYLQSLPAIHNPVPAPSVPAPVIQAVEQMNAKLAATVAAR